MQVVGSKSLRILIVLLVLLGCSTVSGAGGRRALESTPLGANANETKFLAVPDRVAAEKHMQILAAEPHIAGSPEDYKTALYVAQKFREAGLETSIKEYKVWLNYPAEVSVKAYGPKGLIIDGPSPEQVDHDPYQDHPAVLPAFSGYSPSGEVTAEVVYANYGRPEDFKLLEQLGVSVRGKVVLVRYGENFRGVKAFLAQEAGAAALIMYSDPMEDGASKGEAYPKGPWRPEKSVQRGTVEFGFQHPGDPTTPGYASKVDLPESKRLNPVNNPDMPKIPVTPLSAHDAEPILRALRGAESPRDWQGALPFTYRVGPGPVKIHLTLKQDYGYRTIWNVIGKITGTEFPDELVIAGNHRDAWVYGAVDPVAGTVAMLEAVKGLGELLKSGWKPKRTVVFASWDAEEQGLIGSTEWVEEHEEELRRAVAYFNTDTGAAGPNFRASATPSLREFIRDITMVVPSPNGGMLYEQWRTLGRIAPTAAGGSDVALGNLGSGSDYTSFVDHAGVPSSDIRTSGNYGVYHSVFDNYEWYRKFGDPGYEYSQMLARVFGLQVLRMADANVLPYNYQTYGIDIMQYILSAERSAKETFGEGAPDFSPVLRAGRRFVSAGRVLKAQQQAAEQSDSDDLRELNRLLMAVERDLLLPNGLPKRPWFRHAIFAPASLKGYAASVIPGVNEAIESGDLALVTEQIRELANALTRAAVRMESYKAPRASTMRAGK
jgi:N-acetylated-alpha-linked acidic dipeptidase